MPDLSPLAEPDTIPEQLAEETVTMTIPEDAIPANEEIKIDTENNVNTIEQPNPQETTEAKPEEISPSIPQVNNLSTSDDLPPAEIVSTTVGSTLPEVIEKIECDRCHKILNSKEELPAHNLESHNGAPCKFCQNKEEILKKATDYFKKCYESKPQQIPFIEELALIFDVDEDTIGNWAHKKIGESTSLEHPDFFGVYTKLKTMQKLFLSKRTLGRFNPTGAISLLKWHHGMIETSKQILAGSNKEGESLQITITEEKPTITNE